MRRHCQQGTGENICQVLRQVSKSFEMDPSFPEATLLTQLGRSGRLHFLDSVLEAAAELPFNKSSERKFAVESNKAVRGWQG